MKKTKNALIWAVLVGAGLVAGCAGQPKEEVLGEQPKFEKDKELEAEKAAREWKQKATVAIESARARVKEAAGMGATGWQDADSLLKQAEESFDAADYVNANKLANDAKRKAEAAMNDTYLARAKGLLDRAETLKSEMTPEQLSLWGAATQAHGAKDGKKSYDMASTLMAQLEANKTAQAAKAAEQAAAAEKAAQQAQQVQQAQTSGPQGSSYAVVRGDNLWRISAKDSIYGDAYRWPLIYRANRDQIKDADLIRPGQVLSIDRGASQTDIDAAVRHAKTRGAWSLGRQEDADTRYLRKSGK